MSNYIPQFYVDVIIYAYPNLNDILFALHVTKVRLTWHNAKVNIHTS